jgi:hypothetical protein
VRAGRQPVAGGLTYEHLGPVVRLGAKLFAQLQGQRVVQPATFRTHVQKGAAFASRLMRNLSQ